MYRHCQPRPRQQKPSPWIALGVIFFCLYFFNYISLWARPTGLDSVSNISDTESPQSLNYLEKSVYEQINQHRKSKGLPPLVLDGWLTRHARDYSQATAKGEIVFNEQNMESRHQEIVNTGPYKQVGSVLCMTFGHTLPDRTAVNSWLNDPQNRFLSSIEGNYELTGVGVAMNVKGQYYFTQIFLLR